VSDFVLVCVILVMWCDAPLKAVSCRLNEHENTCLGKAHFAARQQAHENRNRHMTCANFEMKQEDSKTKYAGIRYTWQPLHNITRPTGIVIVLATQQRSAPTTRNALLVTPKTAPSASLPVQFPLY